jgi:mannose-6-phosphate isomerase-like protein (cupin superfamily)
MPKYHRGPDPDDIAPDGIEIRHLVNQPQGARHLSMAEGSLKPGQRSRKLYHATYEEIWYFMQGMGVFRLHHPAVAEEEAIVVGSGDAILVPPRHGFWLENTGGEDLLFLLCGSPPWGTGTEVHLWPPHGTIENSNQL